MPLQKHHHFPNHLVLPPGLLNHLQLFLGNTGNLEQPADIILKDIEGIFLEITYDPGGGFRSDPINQPGSQSIFPGRRWSPVFSQWPEGL